MAISMKAQVGACGACSAVRSAPSGPTEAKALMRPSDIHGASGTSATSATRAANDIPPAPKVGNFSVEFRKSQMTPCPQTKNTNKTANTHDRKNFNKHNVSFTNFHDEHF
ncbi:hypothetical protein O3G_MSEX004391 [Manduca sexta]|uniref:Uncharacterized protein n=1 Tax=Manduca sexta TaxID=7130 RepID=A0A921YVB3_MANSE|nr:hypothetical protein O3G_MSEX004391 [Manduca sexta]